MTTVRLNLQQQRAVEHGRGPLLIVAGAGTGKTRVIIERIGHLLATEPETGPENILALTFTDKAAAEMRHRAYQQFGEPARGCRFSTFHSFCYDLLSNEISLKAMDRVDEWIFLRRHLKELDLNHYYRVAEPGQFLKDLVDFFSRCHDNLVSPADYSAYVEKLVNDCAASPDAADAAADKEGDCAPEALSRQQEVARAFERLELLQEQQGLITYGGMISRTITLLDQRPDLLEQLQQRYRFILVDEFQDTNTAQFELLVRLAGTSRHLTVVGDDDQAIYRFRGASFASFHQLAEQYPDHTRIVLDQNYRSTRRILSVAGAAIAVNSEDRYLPDKKLETENAPGDPVEVWEFADEAAQASHGADKIERWVRDGAAGSYSEIAVLYRAHRHRDLLVEALRRRKIPFSIRKQAINSLPIVRDMIAALRAVANPADNISLARLLAIRAANPEESSRWNLSPDAFVALCHQASRERIPLARAIASAPMPGFSGREEFGKLLERFGKLGESERLRSWFPVLLHALGLPRRPEEKPVIDAFTEFLVNWDQEKCETGLLAEFHEYFGYFEEAGGTINLPGEDASAPAEDAAGQPGLWNSPPGQPSGKVQLMTVHAAKGLEFEQVFVWNLVRYAFPGRNRRPLIALPPALWKGPLPKGDFHIEEERRLFYVALTRARRKLLLTTVSNARKRRSRFIEDLEDDSVPGLIWKRPIVASPARPDDAAIIGPPSESGPGSGVSGISRWIETPSPPPEEEKFSLSISQLETYLRCPLQYYFAHIWRIPTPPSPALLFGTLMHAAVKEVVATLSYKPEAVTEEQIPEILRTHWPQKGFPDAVQESKYWELGVEQLEGIRVIWSRGELELLHQEKPFEFQVQGSRMVGRIDQVHRTAEGGVELVEYKTGRPKKKKDADKSLQLTLYGEACRQVVGLQPTVLVLFNLANREALATSRTEGEFRELGEKIQQTRNGILAGAFSPSPGFHCRFCSFRPLCPAQE